MYGFDAVSSGGRSETSGLIASNGKYGEVSELDIATDEGGSPLRARNLSPWSPFSFCSWSIASSSLLINCTALKKRPGLTGRRCRLMLAARDACELFLERLGEDRGDRLDEAKDEREGKRCRVGVLELVVDIIRPSDCKGSGIGG